jgi:hypothetical protein
MNLSILIANDILRIGIEFNILDFFQAVIYCIDTIIILAKVSIDVMNDKRFKGIE